MKHAILAIMILMTVSFAAAQPCEGPPGQPTDVQIPPNQSCGVFMVWRSPPGATYIQSYRGSTPVFADAVPARRSNPTFFMTDYSAPVLTHLYYWLTAGNECGESAPVGPFPVYIQNPSPPVTNFRVTSESCTGVRVAWNRPEGWNYDPGAVVWRSPTPQFAGAVAVSIQDYRATNHFDATGSPGVTYWYWVQPSDDICRGELSGPITATRTAQLAAPLVEAHSVPLCRRILISSTWSQCATSYTLFRNRSPQDQTLIALGTVAGGGYVDTAVVPGHPYTYSAVAHWSGLDSPMSNPITAIAGDSPPTLGAVADQDVVRGSTLFLVAPTDWRQWPESFTYQWRKDGVELTDDGRIVGSQSQELTLLESLDSDSGTYDVIVSYECGTAVSGPGQILVGDGPACNPCRMDYNWDGGVDGADVQAFFLDWEQSGQCADVNADGGIDGSDMETFFVLWESGSC